MTKKQRPINPLNVSTNLVSGVLVGLFIGVSLDKYLDLKPIFTIICLILGICASARLVYKDIK